MFFTLGALATAAFSALANTGTAAAGALATTAVATKGLGVAAVKGTTMLTAKGLACDVAKGVTMGVVTGFGKDFFDYACPGCSGNKVLSGAGVALDAYTFVTSPVYTSVKKGTEWGTRKILK